MKSTNKQETLNPTILLLRRLAAEKRETKRQMREAFETDLEVQRILKELDKQNAGRKPQPI